MKLKNIILLLVVLCYTTILAAQSPATTTGIMKQNIEKINKQIPYAANLNFYTSNKQKLPRVEEMSFRTESDELEFAQQKYQFRVQFNSRKSRRIISHIVHAGKTEYEYRQDLYLLSRLEELNRDIVDWYFLTEKMKVQTEKLILLNDKKTVYQKLLKNTAGFDLDKWLSNEEEIQSTDAILLNASERLRAIAERLSTDSSRDLNLNFDDWITLDKLRLEVANIFANEVESPEIALSRVDEDLAVAEYELEKAKAKKWFDFAQIEYKGNKKLPWQREFSVGAAFNIPISSSNRIKKNKAALAVIDSKYKTQLKEEKLAADWQESKDNLSHLFAQYDLLDEFITQQKLQETLNSYHNGDNTLSPINLIDLQQIILRQKSKKLAIKREIYLAYVKLLHDSGVLIQTPLKNYLSNGKYSLD